MAKHKQGGFKSGIIFILVAALLTAAIYLTWPLITGQGGFRLGGLKSENTIRIASRQAPQSLDIRTEAGSQIEQALLGNVYQTLLRQDSQGHQTPGLAKSWDLSADRLTYTFHLDPDARFDDGQSLNSSAALWSLQQIISKKYVGYEGLSNLASVNNPSASILTIKLKAPDAHLLTALSGRAGIVYNPQAQINYSVQSAGSGPYRVKDWKPGALLTLVNNKQYRGSDRVSNDKILLIYDKTNNERINQVLSNDLDAALDLTPSEVKQAKKSVSPERKDQISLQKCPSQQNVVLAFNNSSGSLLSDQHVREAIRYALDRQTLSDLEAGSAKPLGGPLNELSPGYDAALQAFPRDTTKAAEFASYYQQSYYRGGLRLVYEDSYGQEIGNTISEELSEVGIPSQVTRVDQTTFRNRVLSNHDYDMTLLTMNNDQIGQFANPDSVMLFDNREVQDSWKQVTSSNSQEEYARRLGTYARQVSDLSPSDWLYARTPQNLTRAGLQGMPTSLTDQYLPLWNLKKQS